MCEFLKRQNASSRRSDYGNKHFTVGTRWGRVVGYHYKPQTDSKRHQIKGYIVKAEVFVPSSVVFDRREWSINIIYTLVWGQSELVNRTEEGKGKTIFIVRIGDGNQSTSRRSRSEKRKLFTLSKIPQSSDA